MNSGYSSVELPVSVPGIGYTMKHRAAVEMLIQHYCKKAINKQDGNGVVFTKQDYDIMVNRGKCHDVDKILFSIACPQLTADYLHRMFQGHHEESMIEPDMKNKYDWMEMLFDMESAKYTKADKQGGGAYAFASVYKPTIMSYLLPYFQLFGLDCENPGIVQEIKDSVNRKYYESDLVDLIVEYLHMVKTHRLDGLSRIDDKGYMQAYNNVPPFRRPLRNPNEIIHQRPNQQAMNSRSVMSREMVHGTFEAQLFDYDELCKLSAGQVDSVNRKALGIVKSLVDNKLQR